jgi:hypothetical protein
MTTSGGKSGRTPAADFVLEAGCSMCEEAFAPLADDLPRDRKAGTDLAIANTFRSKKNDFGSEN